VFELRGFVTLHDEPDAMLVADDVPATSSPVEFSVSTELTSVSERVEFERLTTLVP
jgi:hypothetical protein